jgi:CheY-like chemotaxis protein
MCCSVKTESSYCAYLEDEPADIRQVNQKVLSQQLRKAGCAVHVANHGHEALEFLRKTNFWSAREVDMSPVTLDVVLMDVEMPVMDGLTCTRRIRELQHSREITGHVPIIAVSANARSEQMAEAREAGIDDAIAKPFRIPELIPKIEALVRGEEAVMAITRGIGLA